MSGWLRRLRGALGMGVTWGAAWAVMGLVIAVASVLLPFLPWDLVFEVFDAPLPALALPGFVGGALFSVVLGVAGRRRRFHELSLPGFAALGAAGGFLLALVPGVLGLLGLATPTDPAAGLWLFSAVLSVPFTAMGASSAAATLAVARKAEERARLRPGEEETALEAGPGPAALLGRRA